MTTLLRCVIALSLLGVTGFAAPGRPAAARVRADEVLPVAIDHGRVALVGDSIFEIVDDALLAGVPGDVRLAAWGGRRVDEVLARLDPTIAWAPDQVVVELGGNDAIQAGFLGWDLDDTQVAMEELLASFPSADCIHVVLLPEETAVETFDQYFREVNERWRQLPDVDGRVRLLDWGWTQTRSEALGGPPLTLDTVHPSLDGADALAESIRNALDACHHPGQVEVQGFWDTDLDGTRGPDELAIGLGAAQLRADTAVPPVTEPTLGPVGGPVPTFADVEPGDYLAAVDPSSMIVGWQPTAGSWATPVRVEPGTTAVAEIGFAPAGRSISGRVGTDVAGDGTIDPRDPGTPGTPIELVSDHDGDGIPDQTVRSTTTSHDGSYTFLDVPVGTFLVQVTPPVVHGQPAEVLRAPPTVGMTKGSVLREVDIAVGVPPVRVDAEVYLDEDGDGTRGPDEPGIPQVFWSLIELEENASGELEMVELLDLGLAGPDGVMSLTERVPPDAMIGLITLPIDNSLNVRTDLVAVDLPGGFVDGTRGATTRLQIGFGPADPADPGDPLPWRVRLSPTPTATEPG